MTRLAENALIIRPEKCVFGCDSLDFLGHHLNSHGIQPLPSKVAVISKFIRPKSVRQLRRFIGLVNYYHRFLPGVARIMQPLHAVCKQHQSPADHIIEWTPSSDTAFNDVKHLLSTATLLAHPLPNAPLSLSADASDTGVGASLEQWQGGGWRPLGFFSRRLSPTESRYSTFDRELLAAYLAVKHFRVVIEGRHCVLYTDHKPLAHAWCKQSDAWSSRQQRHISGIAEFVTDVRHRTGSKNVVPDCLSRLPLNTVTIGIDYAALAAAQRDCDDTKAYRTAVTSLSVQDVTWENGAFSL